MESLVIYILVLFVWYRSPEAERQTYFTENNTEYIERYREEERQQALEVNFMVICILNCI